MENIEIWKIWYIECSEAVVWRCSVKKVLLEISQNSQENNGARVSFLVKLQTLASSFTKKRLSKSTFLHRTTPLRSVFWTLSNV